LNDSAKKSLKGSDWTRMNTDKASKARKSHHEEHEEREGVEKKAKTDFLP